MIQNHPRLTTTGSDPTRLLRSGTEAANLLRIYAKQTRPGDRDGVAAWYRLRPRLDARPGTAAASSQRNRTRTCLLSGVVTVVFGLCILVKLAPSGAVRDRVEDIGGAGGMEGAGGSERPSGARGSGGTAAAGGLALCPARLG